MRRPGRAYRIARQIASQRTVLEMQRSRQRVDRRQIGPHLARHGTHLGDLAQDHPQDGDVVYARVQWETAGE